MLTTLWNSVLDSWTHGDRLLFVVLNLLAYTIFTWGFNALFYTCDARGWYADRKIQKKAASPQLVSESYKKQLIEVCIHIILFDNMSGQFMIIHPIWYYILFGLLQKCDMSFSRELPSLSTGFYQICILFMMHDAYLYWVHRVSLNF